MSVRQSRWPWNASLTGHWLMHSCCSSLQTLAVLAADGSCYCWLPAQQAGGAQLALRHVVLQRWDGLLLQAAPWLCPCLQTMPVLAVLRLHCQHAALQPPMCTQAWICRQAMLQRITS